MKINLFYIREGYIRTASHKYDMVEGNLDNEFIHLTNNAI